MSDTSLDELKWQFRDLRNAAAVVSTVYLFVSFLCVFAVLPPGGTRGVPPDDLVLVWPIWLVLSALLVVGPSRQTGTGTKALLALGNACLALWLSPWVASLLDRSPPTTYRLPVLGHRREVSGGSAAGLFTRYILVVPDFPELRFDRPNERSSLMVSSAVYGDIERGAATVLVELGQGWMRAQADRLRGPPAHGQVVDYAASRAAWEVRQARQEIASREAARAADKALRERLRSALRDPQPIVVLWSSRLEARATERDQTRAEGEAEAVRRSLSACTRTDLEVFHSIEIPPRTELLVGRRFDALEAAQSWKKRARACADPIAIRTLTALVPPNMSEVGEAR